MKLFDSTIQLLKEITTSKRSDYTDYVADCANIAQLDKHPNWQPYEYRYALMQMVAMLFMTTKYKPQTQAEKKLKADIFTLYKEMVAAAEDTKDPVQLQMLALHQYFIAKLESYQRSAQYLTGAKLTKASSAVFMLVNRMRSAYAFSGHDCSTPSSCSHCDTVVSDQIDLILEHHKILCVQYNISDAGKFKQLLLGVKNNTITDLNMPQKDVILGDNSPATIQNQLGSYTIDLSNYSWMQKRWIHQLQRKHNSVSDYETWTTNNPYKHASRMAKRTAFKWPLALTGLCGCSHPHLCMCYR